MLTFCLSHPADLSEEEEVEEEEEEEEDYLETSCKY